MRRYTTRAAIAAVVLAVSAAGYSYSTFARWPSVPVTFFVNPANADVTPAAAVSAMQYAMAVWNNAGSSFRFQYGGTSTDTTTALDYRNVAIFRNASNGSAIATTYSWWATGGNLVDSDIIMWDGGFRFYTGTSGCGGISNSAYIEDVATHEFGHALGLGHSTAGDATMYPSYSYCSQAFRTLASDDIAGVRALYPGGTPNTAPTVSIMAPANGASFPLGANISFTASASDTQDGNLTSQIQWTDNGTAIGTGGLVSRVLSVLGTHVIVARVTDSGGLQASSQVTITITAAVNTAPSVTITSPANGASFAQNTVVSFTASATDTQDGNLTAQVQWTDNGVGIGSGGSLSRAMSTAGSHTIVARVTDSGGLQGSSQVTITITAPANTAPSVTITSPANGASFVQGTAITFAATASDTQDGNLSAQIQWLDNGSVMGTGATLSRTLALGSHTIVARVTDSGGLQASRQITVTITASSGPATLTATGAVVAGLGGRGMHRVALNWSGLSGASVDVYRNGVRVYAVPNNGSRFDYPGTFAPATPTYTYKVCSAGTTTCTNTVTVSF